MVSMVEKVARALSQAGAADEWTLALEAAEDVLAAIRETHAIVPREPTEASCKAAYIVSERMDWLIDGEAMDEFSRIYAAMIAAAEKE